MNLLYLRYALAVAANGSINKAAEKLYMDQPNLSRCIKDLEASLGVSIFTRSTRGMKPTPEGAEFLKYAEKILKQVDAVENMFRKDYSEKKKFKAKIQYASKLGIPFAMFLGEDEEKNGVVALKDLRKGEQVTVPLSVEDEDDENPAVDAVGLIYEYKLESMEIPVIVE